MVYKSKRKQRKYQRDYKWASRHGTKFKNPFRTRTRGTARWKGLEKIGTEKIRRKGRMIPMRARNGRKPETWLKKPPKRKSTFGGV